MHSKQKFKIEIPYIFKLLEILEKGEGAKEAIKEESGAGENRVITFIEWLKYVGSIETVNKEIVLTQLGKTYLKIRDSHDYVEPLMLYHLAKNPNLEKNDGHYYISEVLNEYLSTKIADYDNKITLESAKEYMINFGADPKYPDFIKDAVKVLEESETGFGKMGILEKIIDDKKNPVYEIHSYWVEPLVGAYIIYDLWKEGQTEMQISSIINDKYHLGRTFLMDEEAIIETLEEIQALGLIDIDLTGGLYQIRKSHRYTKEDILDMMIENS
ncbi:DUF4007 family protein [Cetobacterium somerae]|uniref:DUF4007 family protein n=1 Tax=Cetobacterium somerae TaxID=188913 RepID=UPI003D76735C